MIMRVGGRFPYLHELKSVSQHRGQQEEGMWHCVCVSSLYLSVYRQKELRYLMDSYMQTQNSIINQPMLVQSYLATHEIDIYS